MKKYTQEELDQIIENHRIWLENGKGGERANVREGDFSGLRIHGNLRCSSFVRSRFVRSRFEDSSFEDSSFEDSSFVRSSFEGSSFEDSSFEDSPIEGATFNNCIGNMDEIISLLFDTYIVTITQDRMFIGCQSYTHDEWRDFTDDEIIDLDKDNDALSWWKNWKDIIFSVIEKKFSTVTDKG